MLDRILRDQLYIVRRRDGRPYGSGGFKSMFRRAPAHLGASGLQFHGLRHADGSHRAEAGCTGREIMAPLGRHRASMATHYTRGSEQERLAKAAAPKFKSSTKASKPLGRCV